MKIAKPTALAMVLAAGAAPAAAADYQWPVVRILDGDTVAVDASADMPPELAGLKVRLRGVDTPEKGGRAKCDTERAGGQAATAFTEQAVAEAATILVRDPKWGKWGGRVIADLVLDGRSLSATLIEAGLGRPYDGQETSRMVPVACTAFLDHYAPGSYTCFDELRGKSCEKLAPQYPHGF